MSAGGITFLFVDRDIAHLTLINNGSPFFPPYTSSTPMMCPFRLLSVTPTSCRKSREEGETEIRVFVENVNEFAPKFEQNLYKIKISNDLIPDYPLIQVSATDDDHISVQNR